MIDKIAAEIAIDRFNCALDKAKEASDFDEAIEMLNSAIENISHIENIAKQMKQESHDLTQDIYNRFKNKGYVKTIKY